MCQSEIVPLSCREAEKTTLVVKGSAILNTETVQRKLNPQALEFISSSSNSEVNSPEKSPSSEVDSEEINDLHSLHHVDIRVLPPNPTNLQYQQNMNYIPAEYQPEVAPQIGDNAEGQRNNTMNQHHHSIHPPPPPQQQHQNSGMHHPHHGYGPWSGNSAGYQVYHVAYHNGTTSLERAASPPIGFPNGGSPPLSPGFISVPLQQMDPGSPTSHQNMMYGPPGASPPHSLGSSPPGHYYYVPHYPHPPGNPADFIPHNFSGLTLGSSPPGSMSNLNGTSPTSSNGGRTGGESRASARIARSNRAGGQYNPSDFSFDIEEAESESARTTMMIRNIPNKYNQAVFTAMLERAGFKGTFDFLYLPVDFRNRCGLGYAFVNFISPDATIKLYNQFHGKRWDEQSSKKVCEITYGRIQGRDNLVQHFRTAKFPPDDSATYQPLVYSYQNNSTVGGSSSHKDRETMIAVNGMPIHAYLKFIEEQHQEKTEEEEPVENL